jgi:hypothetical protein
MSPKPAPEEFKAALNRHKRKCSICHHPDREAIEEEFVHWGDVWHIHHDYQLPDYRTVLRHARATGLLERRRQNVHVALDCIVAGVRSAKITADGVIHAIRAYSCLSKDGRWIEPPIRVVFDSNRPLYPDRPSAPDSASSAIGDETNDSAIDVLPAVSSHPDSASPHAPADPPLPPSPATNLIYGREIRKRAKWLKK